MTYGERLRYLCEERNITQKTLSAVIGVSPRMVSFYESGAHFPRDEGILLQLTAYFQVSTDYLLGYSDVRQAGQLHKLNAAYEALPEAERKKPSRVFGLSVAQTEASEGMTAPCARPGSV